MEAMVETPNEKTTQKGAAKKNKYFSLVLGVLVIVGASYGVYKYMYSLNHETTDDAQIESDISPVISRVSGYVKEIRVEDNQKVKAGDTLIVLDASEWVIKVAQAEAVLENAKANFNVTKAGYHTNQANTATTQSNVSVAKAAIETAEAKKWQIDQDYNRFNKLYEQKSVTLREFEQIKAQKDAAGKDLERLKKQYEAAINQSTTAGSETNVAQQRINVAESVLKQRQADLDFAKLQYSYCWITAPEAGIISKKMIQPGQFLQAGQATFALVASDAKWIVANFKETQLEKMKEKQTVEVRVDAYPGKVFHAHIESLSPATGAKFALLPPDNASGNFVKVVQRVPVKMIFDEKEQDIATLRAGMNAIVSVELN